MTDNNKDKTLTQLEELLKHKKSKSYYASKLNISVEEVNDLLRELRQTGSTYYVQSSDYVIPPFTVTYSSSVDCDKGTKKSEVISDFEPKTIEELVELHKVDTERYKVSNYWTKQKGDKFYSSLLCSLIKPTELDIEKFGDYVKSYKSDFKPVNVTFAGGDKVDIEISIADFHLDKFTLDKEKVEERVKRYEDIVNSLVSSVDRVYQINKIVYVIGNDFFHTDNYLNSTTNLTPQDVSMSYNEAYEIGFDLMVRTISQLRAYCSEMDIILVQGNHDRTKSYYLAHALEVYFKADKNIKFNREHSVTKYIKLGNTFIGYHHGNTKIDDLPLLFATSPDSCVDFGTSKYREVHTGDKHFYMAKDIKGVRVQQLPSLSGVDRWHLDNNYVNSVRAAIVTVYHPEEGKIAEFEKRV